MSQSTARGTLENELRDLRRRLIHAHEQERIRLARELHDDVAQRVSALAVELTVLTRESDTLPAGLHDRLIELSSSAAALGHDIHRLSHHLHPAVLQRIGLGPALRAFCRDVAERSTIEIEVQVGQLPRALPEDVTLCLYRIAQEALQNVVRHSGARRAFVTLQAIDTVLVLTVIDDGVGFDSDAPVERASVGLTSMRERVQLVDGQFFLRSRIGEGTRIEVRLPGQGK
jgi:signal transduction histidine kinase